MGLGWSLPALSPGSSNSICQNWLLGGEGDKQFLFLVEPADYPVCFQFDQSEVKCLEASGKSGILSGKGRSATEDGLAWFGE
jgi:hypothetical protein